MGSGSDESFNEDIKVEVIDGKNEKYHGEREKSDRQKQE